MRKMLHAALAALIVSAGGGCRLFCNDRPSYDSRRHDLPTVVAGPPPTVPVVAPPAR